MPTRAAKRRDRRRKARERTKAEQTQTGPITLHAVDRDALTAVAEMYRAELERRQWDPTLVWPPDHDGEQRILRREIERTLVAIAARPEDEPLTISCVVDSTRPVVTALEDVRQEDVEETVAGLRAVVTDKRPQWDGATWSTKHLSYVPARTYREAVVDLLVAIARPPARRYGRPPAGET